MPTNSRLLTPQDDSWDSEAIAMLTGQTVTAIWINEARITFATADKGELTFEAEGDCCSRSYLYSLEGTGRLIGSTITEVWEVDLQPGDVGYHADACGGYGEEQRCGWKPDDDDDGHDYVQVYGFRFTTEHSKWGPVSSVLSFRNDSNGYYGGYLSHLPDTPHGDDQKSITGDWVTDDLKTEGVS